MAQLILGPMLRYRGEGGATIWVEADGPCMVEVNGCAAPTFEVEGHWYGLVPLTGLEPGRTYPYEVRLDGDRRWPEPESPFPPSRIRVPAANEQTEVVFGSCRVALPQRPPFDRDRAEHPLGRGPDALFALAREVACSAPERWPDLLLLLGDQVYADDPSPATREFIRSRRAIAGPHGEDVADFEEYHHLYLEAWREPVLRWLFSTIPSAMIFDDHDVHDDWNTSLAWRRRVRTEPWWVQHIASALTSYWVYQHLGNLSPAELARDPQLAAVRAGGDGGSVLREFARRADREPETARWSYSRDLGRSRLVVIDSRASRVLEPGRRQMMDESEWSWLEAQLEGDFDHLLLATSLPLLLAPGLHDLEAWNEAVCQGAWGRAGVRVGEWMRERFDLEHWAAFRESFERLSALLEDVATGRLGKAPASIVVLSGDVHHSYLAEASVGPRAEAGSVFFQAVCSPFRNELEPRERSVVRFACSRPGHLLGHLLLRSAGVSRPRVRWRLARREPWFANLLGRLHMRGPTCQVRFEEAAMGADGAELLPIFSRKLS